MIVSSSPVAVSVLDPLLPPVKYESLGKNGIIIIIAIIIIILITIIIIIIIPGLDRKISRLGKGVTEDMEC